MKKNILMVVLVAGGLTALVTAVGCKAKETRPTPSGASVSAPAKPQGSASLQAADFTLSDIEGKSVKLSDYKGKVVILDFWATWCPPCVKEIPHFNELARKYSAQGLVVLGVSVDQGGLGAITKFKQDHAVDYRIALSDEPTYKQYQSYLPGDEQGGIPFTFVVDKEGKIREHYVGYRPIEVFETAIKPLF